MPNIAPYQTKEAGTPDLMEYAALIDEGMVLCKDGSVLAGFRFRGDDAASSSAADKNYITAMVNNYLIQFGTGWVVWVDAVRTPSPGYPDPSESRFPDPISAMIDAERREQFESQDMHFETRCVMVFKYTPPSQASSKFKRLFFTETGGSEKAVEYIDSVLAEFKHKLSSIATGLRDLLHMSPMGTIVVGKGDDQYKSDELVNHLHYCLTGNERKLRIPDRPMYMDTWLGYEQFWTGMCPRIGKKYIACVAISGFPRFSSPGILSLLEELPVEYRWSTRFIFRDQQGALATLDKYYRKWKQWAGGSVLSQIRRDGGGEPDRDAASMTEEVNDATKEAKSGAVTFGDYTTVIVLMGEDRKLLELRADYVKKEIEQRGFHARVEDFNAAEAWHGTLPGHSEPNVRRPFVHTLNLSDLLPLSSIWPGLKTNPCSFFPENTPPLMHAVTTGSTPFRVNLHVGDVGHATMFGPTGAGKSTALCITSMQFLRYYRRMHDGEIKLATVTMFDKGYSMYATCSAVGGAHYDIGADDSPLTLCPLAEIDTESDKHWVKEWIGICYELQSENNKKLTPKQKQMVHEAIERMSRAPKETRRLSEFLLSVQDEEIDSALRPYTVGGGLGTLLDGTHDSTVTSHYTVYEIDKLMSMGEQYLLPVMLYLFRKIKKSLTGQPAMLGIDEGWVMLGYETAKKGLREFLNEFRKRNCSVVFATQSLSAAVNSGILDVLIEQCPTKIFLPNVEADSFGPEGKPGPADLYTMFGLNGDEIQLLKNAQYKKDYYLKSPLGRRIFNMDLGPIALAFAGVSDMDDVRDVKKYEKKYGKSWPLYWMKDKGIDYEKYTT